MRSALGQNQHGYTLLHEEVIHIINWHPGGSTQRIEDIVAAHPKLLEIKDKSGSTPTDYARNAGRGDLIKALTPKEKVEAIQQVITAQVEKAVPDSSSNAIEETLKIEEAPQSQDITICETQEVEQIEEAPQNEAAVAKPTLAEYAKGKFNDLVYTDLHKMILNKVSAEVIEEHINQGLCNVDERTPTLSTSLHLAAKEEYLEGLRVLLLNGANTELKNLAGNTPLHTAVKAAIKSGHLEVVKCLLEEGGANQEATNNLGNTPASMAKEYHDLYELFDGDSPLVPEFDSTIFNSI